VHNQWLQVLFSTGLIGFTLFVAALALLMWNARGAYSLVVGSVLVPVFVLSVSERPWLIDSTDWGVWAVPAALLCFPAIHGRRSAADARSDPVTEQRLENTVELDQ
jgi:O-antigen ligase